MLLDTLLLSRCSFLIKGVSMVSEFAIYMNMRLNHSSFDTVLRGQPATLGAPEEAEQHAGAPTEPPPPLSDAPRISYILQYFRYPHALAEIVRRLQHPRLEVVVHADSNTTQDAAAFAAVRSQFPRTRLVHSANLHELRGYNKAAPACARRAARVCAGRLAASAHHGVGRRSGRRLRGGARARHRGAAPRRHLVAQGLRGRLDARGLVVQRLGGQPGATAACGGHSSSPHGFRSIRS